VIIAGSVTYDTIVREGACFRKIGGVSAYAGLTFRLHGIRTAAACNVAPRDRRVRNLFRQYDILVCDGPTPVTTRFVNVQTGDSRRQEAPRLADPVRLIPLLPLLKSVAHVHLGPLHPADLHPEWLAILSRVHKTVSLDVQGYVRKIRDGRVFPAVSKRLPEALRLSRFVKADSEEMAVILERFRMKIETFQDTFGIDELLVTSGRRGGTLRLASGEQIAYEACPAGRESDTTGAGDVLFAAYLARRLYRNESPDASIRHAARIAADQVAGRFIASETLLI